MKPWNGVFQQYRYKAPAGLLVDAGGSVYYNMTPEGVPALWCASECLIGHLHRLWNITHGEAVENLAYIAATGRNW